MLKVLEGILVQSEKKRNSPNTINDPYLKWRASKRVFKAYFIHFRLLPEISFFIFLSLKIPKFRFVRKTKMEAIDSVVDPLRDFAKDSVRLVKRCHKPDRKGIYICICSCYIRFFRSVLIWIDIENFSGFEVLLMGLHGWFVMKNSPKWRSVRRLGSSLWDSLAFSWSWYSSPLTTSSSDLLRYDLNSSSIFVDLIEFYQLYWLGFLWRYFV